MKAMIPKQTQIMVSPSHTSHNTKTSKKCLVTFEEGNYIQFLIHYNGLVLLKIIESFIWARKHFPTFYN